MADARTDGIRRALSKLPAESVTAMMRNPKSHAERTFRGTALLRYAVLTGVVSDRQISSALVSGYFVVTAADGARVAVSVAEARAHGARRVILATEQDGEPLEVGVRLVVPDAPGLAGRSLTEVVGVEFHDLTPDVTPVPTTSSSTITLTGLLDRPGPVETAAFATGDLVDVVTDDVAGHGGSRVAARAYAGMRVYDLLDGAGIRLDPAAREDFLSKIVVARGADGYPVVIAGGEIEPRFRAIQMIAATRRDGAPLGDEGPVRLVVPGDGGPGRWVRGLVSLELREG